MDTNPHNPSHAKGESLTHDEAKSRELAEAYVSGRLPEAESDAFEEHYFACAECWSDVEAIRKLRAGVRDAARGGTLTAPAPGQHWKWAFAAAAVALIALASWTMLVQIPRLERELAAERAKPAPPAPAPVVRMAMAQPNLPVLVLEASRAGAPGSLTVPAGVPLFALWLDAPPSAPRPFRLELLNGANERVELLESLEPNSHGALAASVVAAKFPAGSYIARLYNANGALAGEYKFQVER
ncbi:MAG: zf-HC2 domain-containing protein [Acidobacteria bacterium]|nr:zf-HC2 domain-containing protein [Acidobacteriota bacterium]